jgi:hypothetical protein
LETVAEHRHTSAAAAAAPVTGAVCHHTSGEVVVTETAVVKMKAVEEKEMAEAGAPVRVVLVVLVVVPRHTTPSPHRPTRRRPMTSRERTRSGRLVQSRRLCSR